MTLKTTWQILHRYLGLLSALAAGSTFVLMDLIAQYLMLIDPIDPASIVFFRQAAGAIAAYTYLYIWRREEESEHPFGPREQRPLLALRATTCVIGSACFYAAIPNLALSDTTILMQSRPFLISYMSYLVLNECLTGIQVGASIVAALGEILIVKPPFLFPSAQQVLSATDIGVSHEYSHVRLISMALILVPIFTTSLDMIILRFIRGKVSNGLLMGTYSLGATFWALMNTADGRQLSWLIITNSPLRPPTSLVAWILLFLTSVFGFASQLMMAVALKTETAVTMGIVAQVQVVPSALMEYAAYRTHLDVIGIIGASLTFTSGVLAILLRPKSEEDVEENTVLPGLPRSNVDIERDESGIPLLATPVGSTPRKSEAPRKSEEAQVLNGETVVVRQTA